MTFDWERSTLIASVTVLAIGVTVYAYVASGDNVSLTVATITGNPQNMLIGSVSQIGYARFAAALGPVALFGLAIDAAILVLLFRHELRPGPLDAGGPRRRPVIPARSRRSGCP